MFCFNTLVNLGIIAVQAYGAVKMKTKRFRARIAQWLQSKLKNKQTPLEYSPTKDQLIPNVLPYAEESAR